MNIISISWYLCGVFAVGMIASSFITYAPEVEVYGMTLAMLTGFAACFFAVFSFYAAKLPPSHWIHVSKTLDRMLLFAALVSSLFVMMLIG